MLKNSDQKENIQKINEEIESIVKTSHKEFYINVVKDWLFSYDDGLYLGCEINKADNYVVALYHNETIYLIGTAYKSIMYAPRIMFNHLSESHIHIEDILMKHNNVGNGSIAMRALLLYAKLNGIATITGYLSSIDNDHKERINHYYTKFGFKVSKSSIAKKMEDNICLEE